MIYFELYPGDYLRDTSRLSLLEHGAYLRLLMAYYAEEEPLPGAAADLYVIAGATSAADKAAVRKVADRYFPLSQDGLRYNSRADDEIAKAAERMQGSKDRKAEKKGNETERQRRTRARRTQLFAELRDVGIVPDGMTPMAELKQLHVTHVTGSVDLTNSLLSRVTDRDMSLVNTGVNTGNQTPDPISTPDRSKQAPEISEVATLAGRACLLMRQAGCHTTNPSHPDLLAGLAEGVTPEAYADTVTEGMSRAPPVAKPFAWAITTARARHAQGPKQPPQNTGTHHGTRRLAPADEVEQFIRAREQGGNVIDATPAIAERHGSAVEAHGSDLRTQVDQRLHGESGGRGGGDVVEGSFRVVGSAAR